MELDRVIKERRSVRKFKKLDIPWYLVSECLNAAIEAPSSGNVQNWKFIVVRELVKREKIMKLCEDQPWIVKAPVLIVVCSDSVKIRKLFGIRGEALYSVQNCATAIQNLMLKAYELGLGSCWIGSFDEVQLKEVLSIDDEVRPQAIIALGYPDDSGEKTKREPLENVVSFEKYGEREDKTRKKILPVADAIKNNFGKIIERRKY